MFEEPDIREQKLAEGRKRLKKHLKRAKSRTTTTTTSTSGSTGNNDPNEKQVPSQAESLAASLANGNLLVAEKLQFDTHDVQRQQQQHHALGSSTPQSKTASPMSIGSSLLDEPDLDQNNDDTKSSAEQRTIDILIQERNELRAAITSREGQLGQMEKKLNQMQAAQQQHSLEILNLEVKNKNQAVTLTQQNENSKQYEALHAQLKQVVQETKRKCQSAMHQRDELQTKLTAVHQDAMNWKSQVAVLKKELSKTSQADRHLLEQQNNHLEARLKELCRENEQLMAEREAVARRYRELAPKHMQITEKLDAAEKQRDQFHKLAEETTEQLQQLTDQHQLANERLLQMESELKSQQQRPDETLQNHLKNAEASITQQKHEIVQLHNQLKESRNRIVELEEQSQSYAAVIEQRRGDASVVSRATAQNKLLKEQLIELQDAYVQATNQNMDLATQIDTMKRYSRSLAEELHSSRSGESTSELKHLLASKSKLVESLEDELASARETIEHLSQAKTLISEPTGTIESNDNERDVTQVAQLEPSSMDDNVADTPDDSGTHAVGNSDMHNLLQKQVNRLQLEKETLEADLQDARTQISTKSSEISRLEEEVRDFQRQTAALSRTTSYDFSSTEGARAAATLVGKLKHEIVQLKAEQDELHSKYQYQFSLCNELREKLSREETINDQLSAESETIADYITLYQTQRDKVQMRIKQKDDFIKKMMEEKLGMESQIDKLQTVVKTLVKGHSNPNNQSERSTHSLAKKNPLSDLVAPGGDDEEDDQDRDVNISDPNQDEEPASPFNPEQISPRVTDLVDFSNDQLEEIMKPTCARGSLVVQKCGACTGDLGHV